MACWATDIDSMYLLSSGDSLGDIAHGWWLDYHKYSEYENDFNEVHRKMLSDLEELFGSNNENEDWEKLYQILRDFVWHIISKCNCKMIMILYQKRYLAGTKDIPKNQVETLPPMRLIALISELSTIHHACILQLMILSHIYHRKVSVNTLGPYLRQQKPIIFSKEKD